MKAVLLSFAFVFLLVSAVSGYDVVCFNGTTNETIECNVNNGWESHTNFYRTFFPAQQINYTYTIENLDTSNLAFESYTMNSSRFYSSGVTWNCTDSVTLGGNVYYKCKPNSTICALKIKLNSANWAIDMDTRIYRAVNYSFVDIGQVAYTQTGAGATFYNNENYSYFSLYGYPCDTYQSSTSTKHQVKPNAAAEACLDCNVYVMVNSTPIIDINTPLNGSIQYQNFTVNLTLGNLGVCPTAIVTSEIYNDDGDTLDYIYNETVNDGYYLYDVALAEFGKPFFISSLLYCAGTLTDFRSNEFSVTIANNTANVINDTVINNMYQSICFYTPEPNLYCNTTYQDIYIYYGSELMYNVNDTDETVFCVKDQNLDGDVNITFLNYCGGTGFLIGSDTYSLTFRQTLKYLGEDFNDLVTASIFPLTYLIISLVIIGGLYAFFASIANRGI